MLIVNAMQNVLDTRSKTQTKPEPGIHVGGNEKKERKCEELRKKKEKENTYVPLSVNQIPR